MKSKAAVAPLSTAFPMSKGILLAAWCAALVVPAAALAQTLPDGFVHLRDIDTSIVQDMRYFSSHNFVGRRVRGYENGECILTRAAATALARVQADLQPRGYALQVFDCYRPDRGVKDFAEWAPAPGDPAKAEFYPRLNKNQFHELGYVAHRSGHSRGSTVDLTLTGAQARPPETWRPGMALADCAGPYEQRFADGGIDMGTGYDCFEERSHTASPEIGPLAQRNRALLLKAMSKHGFRNYDKEWWHFTLDREPFPDTYFDFPVAR